MSNQLNVSAHVVSWRHLLPKIKLPKRCPLFSFTLYAEDENLSKNVFNLPLNSISKYLIERLQYCTIHIYSAHECMYTYERTKRNIHTLNA